MVLNPNQDTTVTVTPIVQTLKGGLIVNAWRDLKEMESLAEVRYIV